MIQKKVCLLGASSVGKTSLIRKYVSGIFDDKYLTSIGVKVDKKVLETAKGSIQLLLWDIEGIDQYSLFNPRYIRGASAVIIVVDRTQKQSFIQANEIYNSVRSLSDCPIILAINKNDLNDDNSIEESLKLKCLFDLSFNTSAKTGEKIAELFTELANLLM